MFCQSNPLQTALPGYGSMSATPGIFPIDHVNKVKERNIAGIDLVIQQAAKKLAEKQLFPVSLSYKVTKDGWLKIFYSDELRQRYPIRMLNLFKEHNLAALPNIISEEAFNHNNQGLEDRNNALLLFNFLQELSKDEGLAQVGVTRLKGSLQRNDSQTVPTVYNIIAETVKNKKYLIGTFKLQGASSEIIEMRLNVLKDDFISKINSIRNKLKEFCAASSTPFYEVSIPDLETFSILEGKADILVHCTFDKAPIFLSFSTPLFRQTTDSAPYELNEILTGNYTKEIRNLVDGKIYEILGERGLFQVMENSGLKPIFYNPGSTAADEYYPKDPFTIKICSLEGKRFKECMHLLGKDGKLKNLEQLQRDLEGITNPQAVWIRIAAMVAQELNAFETFGKVFVQVQPEWIFEAGESVMLSVTFENLVNATGNLIKFQLEDTLYNAERGYCKNPRKLAKTLIRFTTKGVLLHSNCEAIKAEIEEYFKTNLSVFIKSFSVGELKNGRIFANLTYLNAQRIEQSIEIPVGPVAPGVYFKPVNEIVKLFKDEIIRQNSGRETTKGEIIYA